ncbi:MAG: hypothetical protein Q7J65_03145, partial [Candidatus Marinimicrobia bacterium]|nr:hypothetical protein [Candidatus Neomarinimicrobiota bacterium]
MKTVRIIRNWPGPGFFRQTPEGRGIWNDIRFTEESTDKYDYVITLNYANYDTPVLCPAKNVWSLQMEP